MAGAHRTAFQDYTHLEFTVAQTVGAVDLPHIDDLAAVGAAVSRAGADTVLDTMPAGLATELGKSFAGGRELSGGSGRSWRLARGMMRTNPLLLVTNDSTAALDPIAEHALFERQAELAHDAANRDGGITVLVSHRFSTVAMADQIVVLDGGTITELGSHAELLAAVGTYAELYEMQAGDYRFGLTAYLRFIHGHDHQAVRCALWMLRE